MKLLAAVAATVPALTICAGISSGISSELKAQDRQGDFIVTAYANAFTKTKGGLFRVSALGGVVTDLKATGALLNSWSIATDPYDDSAIWVGTRSPSKTTAPSIHKVLSVSGRILSTTTLNASLTAADSIIYQVRVLGHRLWFLTAKQLSSIPLTGGKPTVHLKFDATTGQPSNFATDGRNLFVHMQPTRSTLAEHVLHSDIEIPRAQTKVYQTPGITYFMPSLTLDGQGGLLITESEAFSGVSNLKQLDIAGKVLRTFKLPFTHGVAGARMDPAGNVMLVAGKTYDATNKRTVTGFVSLLNWKIFKTQFGSSPEHFTRVGLRRHESLHRYGHACRSASKWNAEISATSLPTVGNTNYRLHLKGLRSANAMLLIGVHGPVPVPLPLSAIGAGTCTLGVRPLMSVPATLDNAGSLTFRAAIPTTASRGNIDIQWLIAERGANRAGFVSSQVGSIAIR